MSLWAQTNEAQATAFAMVIVAQISSIASIRKQTQQYMSKYKKSVGAKQEVEKHMRKRVGEYRVRADAVFDLQLTKHLRSAGVLGADESVDIDWPRLCLSPSIAKSEIAKLKEGDQLDLAVAAFVEEKVANVVRERDSLLMSYRSRG